MAVSRGKGSGFPEGGMCNDFHSRHSLSAGGPGASSALACGVSLATLSPQESRTFRSNQLEFYKRNIVGKLASFQFVKVWLCHQFFDKREFGLVPPQTMKLKQD
ncbi:hypothetical protein LJR015_004128 [Peribacillus frigoritolerans]|uniref:hypothetical protein n=1 Tax=Peribacillus frigoritolerans TaxID=450367 RepID=UPI003ECF33E0